MISRILVVEDEVRLLKHLSQLLAEQSFSVQCCSTYQELENILSEKMNQFEIVVLDRLLYRRDSAELIVKMKNEAPDIKILVLSAINTAAEKAAILDLGADDYLAKPFDSDELIARLKVLLRRNKLNLEIGNLTLNSDRRTIIVAGQEFALQNKEFILLRTLVKTPGKVFSKNLLYDQVWQMSTEVESNVIEATVNKLRRRLKEIGANVMIKNSRNIGYWIEK